MSLVRCKFTLVTPVLGPISYFGLKNSSMNKSFIARHISNIYKEGELNKESTYAKIAYIPATRERSYETVMYNLDVIISVGYRVKSVNGTRFRQWANKILKEYLIKGYAINKEIKEERYNELKEVVRLMSR